MLIFFAAATLLAAEETAPSFLGTGWSGWTAAAILVASMGWFAKVYLPAQAAQAKEKDQQILDILAGKDKQIAEMVGLLLKESESNRESRHKSTNAETTRMANLVTEQRDELRRIADEHKEEFKQLQSGHILDAEKDRQAFMARSENVTMAIQLQTTKFENGLKDQTDRLEKAIKESCKAAPAVVSFKGETGGQK